MISSMEDQPAEPKAAARPSYITLAQPARVRMEERRSVFVAMAAPTAREEEALAMLAAAKTEFPDASHHVYAWVIGGAVRLQRYSDDGEPQGTAGLPVLDILRRQHIEDATIVVVRYFGGTLLGTGGLVHAYGQSASAAVAAAQPVRMTLSESFRVTLGYADYERFRHQAENAGFLLREAVYGMDVDIPVLIPAGRGNELEQLVADCTAGAGLLLPGPPAYVPSALAGADGATTKEQA